MERARLRRNPCAMTRLFENSRSLQSRYFRKRKRPPLACARHPSYPSRAVTPATLAGGQPTQIGGVPTRSKRHRRAARSDWVSFPFHRIPRKPWTRSTNCSRKDEFARERVPAARFPHSRRSGSSPQRASAGTCAVSARAARCCSFWANCSDSSVPSSGLALVSALHELQASIAALTTTR
jgi:hypothetical protein